MQGWRRIARIVAVVAGLTVLVSVLVGLAVGADLDRAVSTGLYLVGSFFLVLGVFAGLRGPVRPRGSDDDRDAGGGLFGMGIFGRGARTATSEERADARATTWLFIGLGVALIVVGVLVDGRASLLP